MNPTIADFRKGSLFGALRPFLLDVLKRYRVWTGEAAVISSKVKALRRRLLMSLSTLLIILLIIVLLGGFSGRFGGYGYGYGHGGVGVIGLILVVLVVLMLLGRI